MREKSTRTGATSALDDVVTGGAWATQLRLKEEHLLKSSSKKDNDLKPRSQGPYQDSMTTSTQLQ